MGGGPAVLIQDDIVQVITVYAQSNNRAEGQSDKSHLRC